MQQINNTEQILDTANTSLTYEENADMLKKNYDNIIEFNYKIHSNNFDGIVDAVINDKQNDKKIYIIFKGRDVLSASPVDVIFLNYIRYLDHTEGKTNYEYMILCERKDADLTRKAFKKLQKYYGLTIRIKEKNQ